ncbi:MAG: hypothetical protein A2Y86_08835 [Candidatus Aminicenantes bacterium RBG_13_62_12]|nr:MAG: hypothetical protein A2Y86_08835 [Candidatus Aminicenantes bacterium RBG_13_62_12]
MVQAGTDSPVPGGLLAQGLLDDADFTINGSILIKRIRMVVDEECANLETRLVPEAVCGCRRKIGDRDVPAEWDSVFSFDKGFKRAYVRPMEKRA